MAKTNKNSRTVIPILDDNDSTSQIKQEYEACQALVNAQPAIVQRFLEAQARELADVILERRSQARFTLPDRVVIKPGQTNTSLVPSDQREQMAGGLMDRITRSDIRVALRQRISELEQSSNQAVAVSAMLVRHTTAMHMVHNMLPAGRSVRYVSAAGEEIPSIPEESTLEPESAITAKTDAIVEEGADEGRGELLVPYVPAARRFYLPQWVAFGSQGEMLVNSVAEAEGHVGSMQRFLAILHAAVGLASYMVVDEVYQLKRYGMLGQLVNQGRALARYQTKEIINTIQRRAKAGDLNRGLSLDIPYFDDQDLVINTYNFEVIPAGRIMFVPAFVVRAAREESAKIAQDTRLSPSTRKHLLAELMLLEAAFESPKKNKQF
jgi:hypothetical protein